MEKGWLTPIYNKSVVYSKHFLLSDTIFTSLSIHFNPISSLSLLSISPWYAYISYVSSCSWFQTRKIIWLAKTTTDTKRAIYWASLKPKQSISMSCAGTNSVLSRVLLKTSKSCALKAWRRQLTDFPTHPYILLKDSGKLKLMLFLSEVGDIQCLL